MKKIILFAAFVCFAALNANAQTEEAESKIAKMLRLTKTADENPADWEAQIEAGHFLLDKENGIYNQSQGDTRFGVSRSRLHADDSGYRQEKR